MWHVIYEWNALYFRQIWHVNRCICTALFAFPTSQSSSCPKVLSYYYPSKMFITEELSEQPASSCSHHGYIRSFTVRLAKVLEYRVFGRGHCPLCTLISYKCKISVKIIIAKLFSKSDWTELKQWVSANGSQFMQNTSEVCNGSLKDTDNKSLQSFLEMV